MILTMSGYAAHFIESAVEFLMTPVPMSFFALGLILYFSGVVKAKLLP